jgi:hypothetical protein
MLAELFRETMCRDFDWVEPGTAEVHLLDRGTDLMSAYAPSPPSPFSRGATPPSRFSAGIAAIRSSPSTTTIWARWRR